MAKNNNWNVVNLSSKAIKALQKKNKKATSNCKNSQADDKINLLLDCGMLPLPTTNWLV